PYVKDADPVRGDPDVVYYQPITATIADGQGSRTINDGTITFTVDTVALPSSKVRSGSTVKITQTSAPNWSGGLHTNVLSFTDNLGTNYPYTWTFPVLGGASGVARADTTNTAGGYVSIPASYGVPLASLDASLPGWRIRSYQSVSEAPSDNSL